ncbi:MAG: FkbM family methyltransferase [Geminicoccaceae bacterium]|nr:FkbM family methyltransferase [Geminicoccaceae bacterium]
MFLLQIGANDGTSTDPVNTILRRGGVKACLVEPQPPVFAKLTETYAGTEHVSFENAAIGTSDGEQSLYVLDSEKFSAAGMYLDNLTGIASFERSHIVEHVARAAKNNIGFGHGISADDFVRETKVATITIETLLTRHAIEHMDILVTDCEGYDFEILKQIDFERFNLGLVVFEHVNLPASERFACWRMLKENGYTITVTDEDTVAYRNIGKRSRTNP